MQSGTNELRLFEEMRLHPWKEADKLKIDAHLAALYVTDRSAAERFQKAYDDKFKAWLGNNAQEATSVPVKKQDATPSDKVSPPKQVQKPKKGKKSLPHSA